MSQASTTKEAMELPLTIDEIVRFLRQCGFDKREHEIALAKKIERVGIEGHPGFKKEIADKPKVYP